MSDVKLLGQGDRIATPNVHKNLLEDFSRALRQLDEDHYKNGVDRIMKEPCGVCKASGIDPDDATPCLACEGTGVDFELHYGIRDGEMYAFTKQYGLDFFKEVCKAHREDEASMTLSQRANRMGVLRFKLPQTVYMELVARGFHKSDFQPTGERYKEICKIIQSDFPDFMCTNYII